MIKLNLGKVTIDYRFVVKFACLTIAYFIAARLSLFLAYAGSNASPIWPPSGIAIAALYLMGYRFAPAVTLAAFAANLLSFSTGTHGLAIESVLVSIAIAIGNTLEACLGVKLIHMYLAGSRLFDNPQNVFKFSLAVVIASLLAASAGTLSLYAGDFITKDIAWTVWMNWWLGDVGGMMVITPLILTWQPKLSSESVKRKLLEVVMTSIFVMGVAILIFGDYFTHNHMDRLLVYFSILVVAWIAYRFKQRAVALAILVFSICAVWATVNNLGPFSSVSQNNSLVLLVGFIVMLSLTGLLLSADIVHRNQIAMDSSSKPITEWLTLLGLLGMTIGSWHFISLDSERAAYHQFEASINEIQLKINQRMKMYEEILQGGIALFAASDEVTHADWSAYFDSLHLQQKLPGILGFGYAEMLKHSDKHRFEAHFRSTFNPSFAIKPSGNRDYYVPVTYLEPQDARNRAAVGYDMYSEKIRRSALLSAALSGHMAISGKIVLIQDVGRSAEAGILMYLPLYEKNKPLTTPELRWQALQGFVYAPFRVQDLMGAVFGASLTDISLKLFDGKAPVLSHLMYDSQFKQTKQPGVSEGAMSKDVPIKIQDHDWLLSFDTLPAFQERVDLQKAQLVLILGLLLSLLLFMLVRSLSVNRDAAVKLAKEMTSALSSSESRLRKFYESTPVMLQSIDPEGRLLSVSDYWLEKHGYTRDEVIGRLATDFMTPEAAAYARDVVYPMAISGSYCKDVAYQKVKKNGDIFDALLSSVTEFDKHGNPLFTTAVLIDVTAENAAKRATDELLGTIRQQFIMYVTDATGVILDVNDAFCESSKYRRAEAIGSNHLMLKSGVHDATYYEEMWKTVASGQSWRGELSNRAKDGFLYWTDSVICPLKDIHGNIERYLAISSDITNRKLAELVSIEQKREIQQIIENQSVATFMIDARHRVLHWNHACEILTGVSFNTVFEKQEAWRGFYTEPRPCLADLILDNRKDLASSYYPVQRPSTLMDKGWHAENWFENLGGKRRYVIFDAAPIFNTNNEVVAVIETLQDVTETKLAELALFEERKNLASVIEGTNAGTWQWNFITNECRFNAQWGNMLGYSINELGDDLFGVWKKLTHEEDYPQVLAQLNRHIAGEVALYESEFRMQHKDGHSVWVQARGRVITTVGGKPEWMYGTHVDITDRKRIDLELRQAYLNLEEFTSVASHDLKSPLRGIADLMDWINEDLGADIPDTVKNNLNRVQIRIKRMETLIDELLQYSRAGAVMNNFTLVDPIEMVREVVDLQHIPATFKVSIDGQEPPFKASETPLKTIVRNLIANAVKHHDREGGQIEIKITAENTYIIFEVKDDGPGIPENEHEAIFKLFNSLSKSTKSTGIGLAVARRMAEAHGGYIKLESSQQDRQTKFSVYWPRFISAV